jgi:hypothetical protein
MKNPLAVLRTVLILHGSTVNNLFFLKEINRTHLPYSLYSLGLKKTQPKRENVTPPKRTNLDKALFRFITLDPS